MAEESTKDAGRSDAKGKRELWHQTIVELVGIVTTVLVAVGVILSQFSTNHQFKEQQQQFKQQLQLAESGQVTERFGRAIDQLGSRSLDVRLGGLYALQRLIHDSPTDESQIVAVISAYVRDHAPLSSTRRHPATDITAAVGILGRLSNPGSEYINLAGVNLTGGNFTCDRLTAANLTGVILNAADLSHANLTNALLNGADLSFADLAGAYGLTRKQLLRAILNGTVLPHGLVVPKSSGSPPPFPVCR